jgi:hypothetical protein
MASARWIGRAARLALSLMGLVVVLGHRSTPCPGQEPLPAASPPPRVWTPVPEALKATLTTGRPTVVLLTSRVNPESLRLKAVLTDLPAFRALAAWVPLTEMTVESYPDQCRGLTSDDLPFAAVYRKGPNGLELAASRKAVADAPAMLAWLGSLGLAPPPVPRGAPAADPGLSRASHDRGGPAPSSQDTPPTQAPPPYPPEKQAPPYYVPGPPAAPPTPSYVPVQPFLGQQAYAAPIPAAAPTYVNLSPPTMVVQQQPQQIIVGPSPPPQVTVVSMGMAPTATLAPAPQPAPAPGPAPMNLMMPAAAPPSAPAPTAGYAPIGYAPAPAYAPAPVYAPAPAYAPAAPAPGPAASSPGVIVANAPGPIDRMLAAIGRNLVRRGYPRIAIAESPTGYAPAMGYLPMAQPVQATLPMTAYAPAPQPSYQPAYALTPQQPQPQPQPLPPGPAPSPQGGNSGHHRFSIFH